jgi:hypothetical protein
MKKLVLSFLMVPLLLPGTAFSQSDGHDKSALKASTISGTVSQDAG